MFVFVSTLLSFFIYLVVHIQIQIHSQVQTGKQNHIVKMPCWDNLFLGVAFFYQTSEAAEDSYFKTGNYVLDGMEGIAKALEFVADGFSAMLRPF